jgi:hypothetical protein
MHARLKKIKTLAMEIADWRNLRGHSSASLLIQLVILRTMEPSTRIKQQEIRISNDYLL